MADDLACASMTAPLRGGNDCGCAAMMKTLSEVRPALSVVGLTLGA